MDKPMNGTVRELSEYAKHQLELDRRSVDYIKKLNETGPIVYRDEDGYLVERSPQGVITHVPGVPCVKVYG